MRHLIAACLLLTACGDARVPNVARVDSPPQPSHVIDSILPIEEHLRRFRKDLPQVSALTGGYGTRDSLVSAFMRATASADSSALVSMLLSRSEYAWLYYPAHIYTRPPYELDPGTFWTLIQGNSVKGFNRLLRERSRRRIVLQGYQCADAATVSPPVREWNQCNLDLTLDGAKATEQLFGSIVELGGHYKFVSYANQF